jgi:hypothetical protein
MAFVVSAISLNADAFTGEYIDEELVLKDVQGNRHIINQYLEDGVSVILNFSSTWCKPCWNYEKRGILDVVWNAFGPDGSKEVVVLFLEADPKTCEDCLYGQQNCNDFSYGDWTQKPYPAISLPQEYLFLNKTYSIRKFPSIIGISSKDKSIHNLGQMNLDKWKTWIIAQSKPIVQSLIRPTSYLKNSTYILEPKIDRIRRAVLKNDKQIMSLENELKKIKINVFPNPCSETVHLEIPENSGGAMVTFYDAIGREVKNRLPKYIPPGTSKISISHLKKGVYHLEIKARDYIASDKFIVLL